MINYLSEPSLNSELILVNNAKKLKENPKLFNDKYLDKIMQLRKEYGKLDNLEDTKGTQKQKREIRDKIRKLSIKTYINRDTDLFGEMILLLIDKMLTRPNFRYYSYKNEMKSLAVEYILKYTWRFDPNKQSKISGQYVSAFAYLSTIIFNAFVASINKYEKENKKIKEDFLETQKLFHLDHKESKYGYGLIEEEYSSPEKEVIFNHIDSNLFDLILKISLDTKNIQVYYPDMYKISLDEYNKITDYSSSNNILLSITPISKKA